MITIWNTVCKLKIWRDTRGQDTVEYGLGAAFLAVVAIALSPQILSILGSFFAKLLATLYGSSGVSGAPPA